MSKAQFGGWSFALICVLAIIASGCGGPEDESGQHGETTAPPPPVAETPPCVISADCPAGEHCDLGECFQDCNSEDPCTGEKTCSPRARCLASGEKDEDPPPATRPAGVVSAEPTASLLTEADTTLQIALTSTSAEAVRYRVQLDAPHLSIAEPRGEFTGSTTLTFDVKSSGLQGRDVGGSIKIWTTLGNVVVDVPIHVGLTGKYHGSMRYDGGLVTLGDARIALHLIETSGDVSALMDPEHSLLFPASTAGPATGFGVYVRGAAFELNLSERIDTTLGGDRNFFKRDLGRKLKLVLTSSDGGSLDGRFEDVIYGLFEQPVTLTGSVHLQYDPGAGEPDFNLSGGLVEMPAAPAGFYEPARLGWQGHSTCTALMAQLCGTDWYATAESAASCYIAWETGSYEPLENSVATLGSDTTYANIAAACKGSLVAEDFDDVKLLTLPTCGTPTAVACALREAADRGSTSDPNNAAIVGRLVGETAAPALLVAQEEIVQALHDSLLPDGTLSELGRYDAAITAVAPTAMWLLQPGLLQHLRLLSAEAAQGEAPTETQDDSYPSARALAKLFTTLAVLDGERTRLSALARGADHATLVQKAQERALVSLLEAATLLGIIESWAPDSVPSGIVAQFTGVLTPVDSGFGALLQGANAFGIPEGFVPFVFDPRNTPKGSTNFEHMLADSKVVVSGYGQLEESYTTNARAFEANQAALQRELAQLKATFDTRIADLCGPTPDPDSVTSDADWDACMGGDVGVLLLEISGAEARRLSAENRIRGMKDKIAIDERALAATQGVHESTLRFLDTNGKELQATVFAEGIISAEQSAIATASNSSIVNLGAPAGMAVASAVLELEKASLEARRQELQTAQSMRFEEASAKIEKINGMASIQRETIDLAQLAVDIQQDVIAVEQAKLRAFNAVEQAKRLFDDRRRMLAVVDLDPAHDPSFRILRDSLALNLLGARARAQRQLYLAARALEYEINAPIAALSGAVLNARNKINMEGLSSCMTEVFNGYRQAYGTPQKYITEISVRKQLGITGPRTDEVTGQTLSEGEQFRQLVLRNENLDGKGGVGVTFATNLQPGNGLWSTDVCADRIDGVRAQLVGDFLGDATAKVHVLLSGGSIVRDCRSEALNSWSFGSTQGGNGAFAAIQAGVNSFGTASANTSLFGQSVARATWQILIPGGHFAAENSDLSLDKLEDVVLEISHEAVPVHPAPINVDLSCLSAIQ